MKYAELCVTTNFTFLTGASHPEELVLHAAHLGLEAIAITDRNSVAGVVRAWKALKELTRVRDQAVNDGVLVIRSRRLMDHSSRQVLTHSTGEETLPVFEHLPRLIVGSRLVLDNGEEWLALPTDKPAWGRLSRMLSEGKRRAKKGECHLTLGSVLKWGRGMILIALTDPSPKVIRAFPGHVYLGAAPRYDGQDAARIAALSARADALGIPMVAVGDVLMHRSSRRPLADVLTCMRLGVTIDNIGRARLPNAERRLKTGAELARLFPPDAIARSVEIAERCTFDLKELEYEYPHEEKDEPAQQRLERLAAEGLARRYDGIVPPKHSDQLRRELDMVAKVKYAPYFLTVADIVNFARGEGILCQGRGSAANSLICWALQITEVSPDDIDLIFERFISEERNEPPDIDVDFEHERREEVIQHIYKTYGRKRAGLTATVIHFRSRAAIREVGKVMGLSQDVIARLSGQIWGWSSAAPDDDRVRNAGLSLDDRRVRLTLALIGQIIGFPRHLSQHVGGFVITQGRLDELCPIENAAMEDRTIIEWDKDDIDALGILKVDVLGLGMLTCIRKAFKLLRDHEGVEVDLSMPPKDKPTYDMLCRADAVGVFQVESRAQMNFLPKMQPRNLYDLVCEVAIVRPGPIQGGMVHPFIDRRRRRSETPDMGALTPILDRTYGVPLFQEQAMQIAIHGAGFTPSQADEMRRALATFKKMGTIGQLKDRFIGGMIRNHHDPEFAERCFAQIEGFSSYGFPQSHAASFARLVFISAWLKCHHQAAFTCALLNSQPMGFYAPAQLVRDALDHGVEVRGVSVNHSQWDCTLEQGALRLGFRQIKGVKEEDGLWIAHARGNGYPDVESLWRRAGIPAAVLERLAEADAFACLALTRREALWQAKAMRSSPLPLFGVDGEGGAEPMVALPQMGLGEETIEDYLSMRLSLRAHPLGLLRPHMPRLIAHGALDRGRVTVAGLVITRQRPGTASGVIFLTLEDETGYANIVVWNKVYERFRREVISGRLLRVTGRIERDGQVIHIIAERIEDASQLLSALGRGKIDPCDVRRDEIRRPAGGSICAPATHPRHQAGRLFPSRDFH
ncbi:error-prone DNA polymerase [Cereibacter sp. SYSU M97828]|nr:error-prone DNA polymerase [Cereibacter flavus]